MNVTQLRPLWTWAVDVDGDGPAVAVSARPRKWWKGAGLAGARGGQLDQTSRDATKTQFGRCQTGRICGDEGVECRRRGRESKSGQTWPRWKH